MRNHNTLIGRYPVADGGKTGFICASGFNVVASATRNGRALIAVVAGAPSSPVRGAKGAGMLERGFNSRGGLGWLTPSLGSVETLQAIDSAPPDMREEMCGKHRKRPAAEEADDEPAVANNNHQADPNTPTAFMLSSLAPSTIKNSQLIAPPGPVKPIIVYAGPPKKSADTQVAATQSQTKPDKKNAKTAGKDAKQAAAVNPSAATAPAQGSSAAAAPNAQTISAARPDSFGPPPGRFTPSAQRAQPSASDNSSFMSFAPAARAEPAPLTAAPQPPQRAAGVPMPRPRPKPQPRVSP